MSLLPKRDLRDRQQQQFSIKLPLWLIQRLDEIGEVEAYSRTALIREVLRSFVEEWGASTAAPAPSSSPASKH